jgi:hypothetical protein
VGLAQVHRPEGIGRAPCQAIARQLWLIGNRLQEALTVSRLSRDGRQTKSVQIMNGMDRPL